MKHIKKHVNIFHFGFNSFYYDIDTDIDIAKKQCANIECPYFYDKGVVYCFNCQYNDPLKAIYPYG